MQERKGGVSSFKGKNLIDFPYPLGYKVGTLIAKGNK